MYIAICEDDAFELTKITSLLDAYIKVKKSPIIYQTFQSAIDLLSDTHYTEYDVFILDIIMPGVSGIDAAYDIRQKNTEAKIVFLTSSPEFAVESYSVKAYDYIMKPITESRLYSILDSMIFEHENPKEGITIKTSTGLSRILFSKLAYVEIMNKKLYFNLSHGAVKEVAAPLSQYEPKLLCRPEFIKVHRSYIVNLWHISTLSPSGIIIDCGKNIPVSRLIYSKVKNAYMEHLFVEKGVE